ncbi:unnamed protein product [Bursaphelenchus xylophilus]|uniref:(pine wood nematode) hypothetical protein n=1 Tax=Bursaphelenchus xylophilus TaxID=6326 RepID=A0A1I7SVG9_BURXY|nr:unnamed protein product [Bursaphelenchus xylophilus]CAG9101436.1 unnamed protein product [Bursaphelenchus xylophilus]
MSTEYGVNISNKFAFLDDEGTDPAELLARAAKEKKEKQRLAKVAAKAPAPEPVKPVRENNENRKPAGQRGGPRAPRREGDLSERFGEKRREFRPRRDGEGGGRREGGEYRPRREGETGEYRPRRDGEDRPRGPRKPREPREGENTEVVDGERPPRRYNGNRPFRGPRQDRVSGSDKTGVKSVPKKDGHGKGNWGDDQDELVGETEQLNVSDNKENGAAAEATEVQEVVEEQPEEEKEPPKLTLAEWKAQQQQAKQEFKTRKANEGADQKALQKFVPLKKDNEEDEYEEVEEHIAPTKRQQSQKTVDININFNDPNRRDNRGERRFNERRPGGERSDRPQRGPPRQDNRGPARGPRRGPQIDLAHDFPALGA